jgi:hypothetical protein
VRVRVAEHRYDHHPNPRPPGISSDGVHFDRLNKPVMEATEPYELPAAARIRASSRSAAATS